jgi:hypothetical protein
MCRLLAVVLVAAAIAGALAVATAAPVAAQAQTAVPWLRLEPACLQPDGASRIRVLGSGFQPGTRVDITMLSPGPVLLSARLRPAMTATPRARTAQSLPVLATGAVDGLGTFETRFYWPGGGPFGEYEVRARTRGGGPQRDETMVMPCDGESLTVNTRCGQVPGGAAPPRIIIRGQGYIPGDDQISVEIWEPGTDGGGPLRRRDVSAGGDGTFRVEFGIANLPPGRYDVTAYSNLDYGTQTTFETPCPAMEVVITPDCGPPGGPPDLMSIRVEARGLLRRQRAFIIFDTQRSFEVFPTRTDPDGRLVADISPYQRRAGTYSVRVRTENDETGLVRQRSTDFTIPCERIVADLSATECRRPAIDGEDEWRWQIDLTGRRFRPGDVAITFDAVGVVGPQRFTVSADDSGRLQATIDPIAGPIGSYRIVARQGGSDTPAQAGVTAFHAVNGQTTFRSPCEEREPAPAPTLVDVCGPEAPGQDDAYRIAVSGGGFYPGGVVYIVFGSGPDGEVFQVGAPDGTYGRSIAPDGLPEGQYPVRVSQRDVGRNVVATSRRALFTVPCPIDPTLEVVPDQGPAGYTALVQGRDFRPGSTVTLAWDRGLQAGIPIDVEVGEDGTFDVYLFILPNDWPGERILTAGLPEDPDAFPEVTDVYLVVPGSGVPPGPAGEIVNRR